MTRLALTAALIAALERGRRVELRLRVASRSEPMAPWETSSVLQTMPRGQHAGAAILGTSHARTLSWCPDSARALEAALGCDVINLAKNAAGPMPMRLYLEEFLARGNSADTLIYVADPWTFYAAQWNEEHGFLMSEPFDLQFFVRCLKAGRSPRQLFRNLRGGFFAQSFQDELDEQAKCATANCPQSTAARSNIASTIFIDAIHRSMRSRSTSQNSTRFLRSRRNTGCEFGS
jgi:hypothetical protein